MIKTASVIRAEESAQQTTKGIAQRAISEQEKDELRPFFPLVEKLFAVAEKISEGDGLTREYEISRKNIPYGYSGMGLDIDKTLGTLMILKMSWDKTKHELVLSDVRIRYLPGTWSDGFHNPETIEDSSLVSVQKGNYFELAKIIRDHNITLYCLERTHSLIRV